MRLILRVLLIGWGLILAGAGARDLLSPRGRFLESRPAPNAVLESAPSAVEIEFTDALAPESRIDVQSTITLLPTGEQEPTGGVKVTRSAGVDARDHARRTLRAELEPGVPGGLFAVRWTAVAARGGAQRFGSFYFGVGMAVPEHITRDMGGPVRERNYRGRGFRSAVVGGAIMILLGIFLPRFRRP